MSALAFPSDLADEGVETVLGNLQDRAGVDGITPAFVYHAARDVFPHNPRRKVVLHDRGALLYPPDRALYEGLRIESRVDAAALEHDVLAETRRAAAARGLAVRVDGLSACRPPRRAPRLRHGERLRRPVPGRSLPREPRGASPRPRACRRHRALRPADVHEQVPPPRHAAARRRRRLHVAAGAASRHRPRGGEPPSRFLRRRCARPPAIWPDLQKEFADRLHARARPHTGCDARCGEADATARDRGQLPASGPPTARSPRPSRSSRG